MFSLEFLKTELHVNHLDVIQILVLHDLGIQYPSSKYNWTNDNSCVSRSYYLVRGYVFCVNGTRSLLHSLNEYRQSFSRNISFGLENDPELWLASSTKVKGGNIDITVWPKGLTIRNDS